MYFLIDVVVAVVVVVVVVFVGFPNRVSNNTKQNPSMSHVFKFVVNIWLFLLFRLRKIPQCSMSTCNIICMSFQHLVVWQ